MKKVKFLIDWHVHSINKSFKKDETVDLPASSAAFAVDRKAATYVFDVKSSPSAEKVKPGKKAGK